VSRESITAALQKHGPLTSAELQGILGIGQPAISRSIRYLRKHEKVRIKEWLACIGRGKCAPVYMLASEPFRADAPYPKALTAKEINKRYREKHKVLLSLRRYGAASKSVGMWAGLR
jgi:predicted ArsR family transcriptional regulator